MSRKEYFRKYRAENRLIINHRNKLWMRKKRRQELLVKLSTEKDLKDKNKTDNIKLVESINQ